MSQSVDEHHSHAPTCVACAVLTVSDTRTLATDTGGKAAIELLEAAGHSVVAREIVPDEPSAIRAILLGWRDRGDVQATLLTGGTGIAGRDQTFETISGLLTKTLPGYGELFRFLSFQEIGPAAMLSRAVGGLLERMLVLTMPGSPAAVRLAMQQLILPELGHLVHEARR